MSGLLGLAPENHRCDGGQILEPGAQRRQVDRPAERASESRDEAPGCHFLVYVARCCHDHAHVERVSSIACLVQRAEALSEPLLRVAGEMLDTLEVQSAR